jgi:hypothetical protein
MLDSSIHRVCGRCMVSKPLKEYDTFATKPGRKKVCNECLATMKARRDKIKQGLPVPPRTYGPRKHRPEVIKPKRVAAPQPEIVPTDGIPWPATTNM